LPLRIVDKKQRANSPPFMVCAVRAYPRRQLSQFADSLEVMPSLKLFVCKGTGVPPLGRVERGEKRVVQASAKRGCKA
jgi:hypothetical protein